MPERRTRTGQEEENVALGLFNLVDLDSSADGGLEIVAFRLGRVENLHGEGPPGNVHARALVKVLLELASIQRGTHNDDFQIFALQQDLAEGKKKEMRWGVDREASI